MGIPSQASKNEEGVETRHGTPKRKYGEGIVQTTNKQFVWWRKL